jgi:signal transduction histidine kinase
MATVSTVSILLVDDHAENLLALEAILKDTGHELVRARSGAEALKAVLRQEFALILMDVAMPGLDGYETAELIRGRARSRSTPIIFLTANAESETHVFRGYSVGAVDYLFKPFVPEVLLSKVAVFVELHAKRQALEESADALRQAYEDMERRVEERTLELRQSNQALQAEMIERRCAELERAELLEREQRARLEAQAANRMKDEFLATLSHELRTPLNAILGWIQILEVKRDDMTVERATRVIKSNAQAQAQLVGDILDVSRIIGGKLNLRLDRVMLKNVIEATLESVQPDAVAKEIALRTRLAPVAPIVAAGDRLQQVMWNLLSNAIKFTPRGGEVSIGMETDADDIVVTVADSGQGIEPDFIPRVFDRFTQADGSLSRSHGGLGLGMAIVRYLVELHGGTVKVASPGKDQGATFTLSLPRGSAQAEVPARTAERTVEARDPQWGPVPELDEITVLVVDDDPDARDVLEELLRFHGARVTVTASAAEALQVFTERRPQVLISDIAMPGQNGLDLIRRIRGLQPHCGGQIPAIALTAHAGPTDSVAALDAGFHRHLVKPVDPRELVDAVAQLVGADRAGKTRV